LKDSFESWSNTAALRLFEYTEVFVEPILNNEISVRLSRRETNTDQKGDIPRVFRLSAALVNKIKEFSVKD
jgi:hypothetical protein